MHKLITMAIAASLGLGGSAVTSHATDPIPRDQRLAIQLTKERAAHHAEVSRLRSRLRVRLNSPTAQSAMTIASIVYGIPVSGLRALAWCESRSQQFARNPTPIGNSHATGFTQILFPSTWATTPYASLSPYDLTANVLAAAYIWRRAGGSFREWADVCATAGNNAS